ncbi:MAG: lipoprotein insertase outer membrane protein LolB [Candidatus Berkiellales bacterium]
MRALILVLFICLAGCAQQPKKAPSTPLPPSHEDATKWEHHQQQLKAMNHWQAHGRFAVAKGQKGGNASFIWHQAGENYKIKIFGPFASGTVLISGNPHQVKIQEPNGKITTAHSPEQLMQKRVGWYVPIVGLNYWLRGLPSPKSKPTIELFDHLGHLLKLQQENWKIDYSKYSLNNFIYMPSQLRLQNNELIIKMVVTSWEAPSS